MIFIIIMDISEINFSIYLLQDIFQKLGDMIIGQIIQGIIIYGDEQEIILLIDCDLMQQIIHEDSDHAQ
jgi:hypothetical protein